jgi:hypothetical protein
MPGLTVSGNSIPLNEYVSGVNITATVTANASIDGSVTSVRVFRGQYATGTNITINGSSISINGAYSSVFPKSITYLDVDRVAQTVSKFEDLPEKFFLLTNYTASQSSSVNAQYFVYADTTGNATSESGAGAQSNVFAGTISQTVTNDYTAGQLALQAAVPKGIF